MCQHPDFMPLPLETNLLRIAEEMEASLWSDLLDRWFPACINPFGGFYERFSATWEKGDSPTKSIVFQARMTWLAATVAEAFPDRRDQYLQYAGHGADLLNLAFVEPETGAVRWEIDGSGQPTQGHGGELHTYGTAFALYALSAHARVTKNLESRRSIGLILSWLIDQARDNVHGGYFEAIGADGKPVLHPSMSKTGSGLDAIGTPYGLKSQNTHLHLLEALTECARVIRTPEVRTYLIEVRDLLCEQFFHRDGWLHLYVKPDWTPVANAVSYGHDIEAAHLLMDASEVLGVRPNKVPRALIEHTLRHGLDQSAGVVVNLGDPAGPLVDPNRIWWVQAEAMLGLARGMELPHAPISDYLDALERIWNWAKECQIDRRNGGWHEVIRPDGQVGGSDAKAHPWKAAYHDGRALIFTPRVLRRVASRLG